MVAMTRCRPILVVAAAALAAACSGDGDGASASSTTAAASTAATATGPEPTRPVEDGALRLDVRGLGPVRVGMTVAEAGAALGRPLQPVVPPPDEECAMYAPESGFDGLAFLVASGVVARADVTAGPTSTAEGLAIGVTEEEAQRRYGGRLEVSPHDYNLGGHYLTLVPSDPADAQFRLVAETDGTRVTSMRAGRLPEVGYTEACS